MSDLKSFLESEMAKIGAGGRPAGGGIYETTLLRVNREINAPVTTRVFALAMGHLRDKRPDDAAVNNSLGQLLKRAAVVKLQPVGGGLVHWWHPQAGPYDARKFQPYPSREPIHRKRVLHAVT